ncbi:hypothetical protein [Rhodanobacter sp. BL-MT-08]
MSHSMIATSALSKRLFFALALSAGVLSAATAQSSPSAPPAASSSDQASTTSKKTGADHRLIRPGDRTCLRSTGSLIPPKNGDCLPVAGRSYSHDELRNTGAIDNAHALQMLDPSISLGH